MFNIAISILKKIDPKWIPALVTGITILGSIIYLIYTKRKAEALNKELSKKLALAESEALEAQAQDKADEADKHELEALKHVEEIDKLKKELRNLNQKSAAKREKILKATSWEELGL